MTLVIKVEQRSVLDSMEYRPGNRPYWEMKEGWVTFQYPDLLRVIKKELDSSRRRQLVN